MYPCAPWGVKIHKISWLSSAPISRDQIVELEPSGKSSELLISSQITSVESSIEEL